MLWLNKNKKLNVLVVGDKGQLGSYLKKLLQDDSRREKSMFGVVAGVDLPEVDTKLGLAALHFGVWTQHQRCQPLHQSRRIFVPAE